MKNPRQFSPLPRSSRKNRLLASLKGLNDSPATRLKAPGKIREFRKQLVIAAATQLSAEFDKFRKENPVDASEVAKMISSILKATDLEHDCANKEDSLQIVGRLSPFASSILQNEHSGMMVKAAMRLATDELRLVLQRTQRHSGWISGEVSLLHGQGKRRLDEVDMLINVMNDKEVDKNAIANIALKLTALYAQMIRYGTEFSEKWDRLNNEFVPFIKLARKKMNESDEARQQCLKDTTTCLEDLKEQLEKLVKAADNLPGDESQKHVDVCIALYQAMRAMHQPKTSPSKPFCLSSFLNSVALIALGAVLCAVAGEVCKNLSATRGSIESPTPGEKKPQEIHKV